MQMKYGEQGLDGCAFPALLPEEMGVREGYFDAGMTKREHAAIALRIPNSGDEHIDAMIRQANRRDAAVAAMQGQLAAQGTEVGEWSELAFPELARISVALADTLLARLEEKP